MAAHESGGAAARLCESFQQTGDNVKNISYFLDHVETVRMCTASASSQTCRPVLQGYDVFFGPKLNNPLYSSGEPYTLYYRIGNRHFYSSVVTIICRI